MWRRGRIVTDISHAKALLAEGYTLALVCGEEAITSGERGIAPLLKLVTVGKRLEGFSAADKIVGKAAALLYVFLGVREVYAEVLSRDAKRVLEAHGIACSCAQCTEHIINRRGDGLCPMEQAVSGTESPEEAITLLRDTIERMKPTGKH